MARSGAMAVVAGQPGPQSGAQERRFAGARRAENDQQPRRLARRQTAQHVDAAHDVGVAAEEDGGILRLQRLQAAVGSAPAERTVGIGQQLEGLGADAGLVEATLELRKAGLREVNRGLAAGQRMGGDKAFRRLSLERHDLPLRGEPAGQAIKRNVVDEKRKQLLVETVRELILVAAPFGREPFFGDQEQNRFAARRRILERTHPALPRGDAVLRVEVEKNIVRPAPALPDEPILERDRGVIVCARMADEQA
jgi:hypothetical protein